MDWFIGWFTGCIIFWFGGLLICDLSISNFFILSEIDKLLSKLSVLGAMSSFIFLNDIKFESSLKPEKLLLWLFVTELFSKICFFLWVSTGVIKSGISRTFFLEYGELFLSIINFSILFEISLFGISKLLFLISGS